MGNRFAHELTVVIGCRFAGFNIYEAGDCDASVVVGETFEISVLQARGAENGIAITARWAQDRRTDAILK